MEGKYESAYWRADSNRVVHPEHCIEYEPVQLRGLLEEAGFLIQNVIMGVCEMPSTVRSGMLDYKDFLYGSAITTKVEQSYIQYFHCVKPWRSLSITPVIKQ